jgi:hypothetical protein
VTGSCQAAIESYLTAHSEGTIVTSSSSNLAAAVAAAIAANHNSSLVPGEFAESALLPYPYGTNGSGGSVRSEPGRDAAAVLVTGAAINQVIATGTSATIPAAALEDHIAGIVQSVIDVSGSNTADDLTQAGRTSVLSKALTTITNDYASASAGIKVDLIAADAAVGEALVRDSFLEGLPNKGLNPILIAAMPGVTGTNPALAPQAANAFVVGLLTSSSGTFIYPDEGQGASIDGFAVNILSDVIGNTSIDALVSHAIGLRVYNLYAQPANGLSAVVTLGKTLFSVYPSTNPAIETALTEGLTAGVPQGAGQEDQRASFAQDLTAADVASAPNIEEGAIFVDPYYAGEFTHKIFTSVYNSSAATLAADAPTLATDAGNIIGSDGNVLTNVANTFGQFITAGELSATNAGTYAYNLIVGAQNGTIAAGSILGGGGKLALGPAITVGSVVDLASIADVLALGVTDYFGHNVTADASAYASDIGLIAEKIAAIVTTESFTNPGKTSQSGPIAEFIAGTLADYITGLQLDGGSTAPGSPQTLALEAIKTDVEAAINASGASQSTKNTVDSDVTTAVNTSPTHANAYAGNYDGDYGAIAVQETTVTNL